MRINPTPSPLCTVREHPMCAAFSDTSEIAFQIDACMYVYIKEK